MLNEKDRMVTMEILHRLELEEPVSVDELIYLNMKASQYPEIDSWVGKLLKTEEFLPVEANMIHEKIAV